MSFTPKCCTQAIYRLRLRPLALLLLALASLWPHTSHAQAGGSAEPAVPLINIPYYAANPDPAKGAVFWLGKVDPTTNYADVRMVYSDSGMSVVLHIFDRLVTYDENATATSDLTQWDSVSLYLDTQPDLAAPMQAGTYRFDVQLSHWQARTNYVRAFRWQDGAWQDAGIVLVTNAWFHGYPNDSDDDRGWGTEIALPFSGAGLPAPGQGTTWRMALVLHDRDTVTGGPLPDQTWPAKVTLSQPPTWGRIRFGAPAYTPPTATVSRQDTLRHGVNGIQAPDAAVGGHSECGAQFNPNFFDGWGDAKYVGYAQLNIQNQWDVADWPCFSKYYVTFPLDSMPNTAIVISATLTMYMFGNAGYTGDDAKPSFIQAARVAEDWNEQTVTWNNGPPVLENYSWTVVNPMQDGDPVPKPATWDVTRAVADAHAAGEPLRLSLYSSDGDYHSGKYFWSADAGEELRPLLKIAWGSKGYTISVVPVKSTIAAGETAQYELNVTGLNSGETVTLEAGQSSPAGLEVTVTPKTIAAPGGKVVVTLRDNTDKDSSESIVYTVPVTADNGQETRTVDLSVLVNGQFLFLPSLLRK